MIDVDYDEVTIIFIHQNSVNYNIKFPLSIVSAFLRLQKTGKERMPHPPIVIDNPNVYTQTPHHYTAQPPLSSLINISNTTLIDASAFPRSMFPMGALVAAVVTGAIFIATLSIAKKKQKSQSTDDLPFY